MSKELEQPKPSGQPKQSGRLTQSTEFNLMVRTAQSVTHRYVADRRKADWIGYSIADFAAVNWGTVSQDFGSGAEDEAEIVERVARVVVKELITPNANAA